jgi:hypothetical protein
MLEVSNIGRQVRDINRKINNKEIKVVDIQVLIKHLTDFMKKFNNVRAEIYPLKSSCRGFIKALTYAAGWKDDDLMEKAAVQANNILVISKDLVNNPKGAQEKYGDLATIKGNIQTSLDHLVDALTAIIKDVEALEAQRKHAKV